MSGGLNTIDKHHGVRLVGVGKTWRIIFDRNMRKVKGPEATMTCQDYQLCAGLNVDLTVRGDTTKRESHRAQLER